MCKKKGPQSFFLLTQRNEGNMSEVIWEKVRDVRSAFWRDIKQEEGTEKYVAFLRLVVGLSGITTALKELKLDEDNALIEEICRNFFVWEQVAGPQLEPQDWVVEPVVVEPREQVLRKPKAKKTRKRGVEEEEEEEEERHARQKKSTVARDERRERREIRKTTTKELAKAPDCKRETLEKVIKAIDDGVQRKSRSKQLDVDFASTLDELVQEMLQAQGCDVPSRVASVFRLYDQAKLVQYPLKCIHCL